MFYTPYWIMIAIFVILAIISIIIKGFNIIDFQVFVMMVAISLFLDMVFCKWLNMYAYVTTEDLNAWYSLGFCVLGYPAIGLIFLKFLPKTKSKAYMYIGIWTVVLTKIELVFAVPYKIVLYDGWNIVPDSIIIYAICFWWVYGYNEILKRKIKV